MDVLFSWQQRVYGSRGASVQLARIAQGMAEQLDKAWPLSCTQLDLVCRSLASWQMIADNINGHVVTRADVSWGVA